MPRWAIANDNAMRELPVAAVWMRGVVSFNCDACHNILYMRGEPSWMRFEPAINAGVVPSIYVGGATGSMGSLQTFSTQHKTRNQGPMPPSTPGSCLPKLRKTPECCCLPLPAGVRAREKERGKTRFIIRSVSSLPSTIYVGTFYSG